MLVGWNIPDISRNLEIFQNYLEIQRYLLDGGRHCWEDAKVYKLLPGFGRKRRLFSAKSSDYYDLLLPLLNECCSDNDNNNTYNNNIHCHNHLVGAITTRRMRAAVTMMLTKAYTQRTNVLTEEPG